MKSLWCIFGIHDWVDDDGFIRSGGPSPHYPAACIRPGCYKTNRGQVALTTAERAKIVKEKLALASGEKPERARLSLVANGVGGESGGSDGNGT